MAYDRIDLFGGEIKANRIGIFERAGVVFDIVRPGYDSQGRRRIAWTQFVYKGVPVFEVRKRCSLDTTFEQFDKLWDKHIQDDKELLIAALEACSKERRKKFRDGVTGESPAPALTHDGRPEGKRYPA